MMFKTLWFYLKKEKYVGERVDDNKFIYKTEEQSIKVRWVCLIIFKKGRIKFEFS